MLHCIYFSNRYVEQINPLLVQAQRKLVQRIKQYDGAPAPQPHFVTAMEECGKPLQAKKYVNLQLKLQLNPEDLAKIDPGAHIDPNGHNIYGIDTVFLVVFFIIFLYVLPVTSCSAWLFFHTVLGKCTTIYC